MTVPRWHKKLAAAGLVLGLVAIVAVALTMFSGGFTKSTPITVTSTRAGLVMEPNAKVKLARSAGWPASNRSPSTATRQT